MPAPLYDVFICYSRKDGEFAAKLERAREGRYRVGRELGEGEILETPQGSPRRNPR